MEEIIDNKNAINWTVMMAPVQNSISHGRRVSFFLHSTKGKFLRFTMSLQRGWGECNRHHCRKRNARERWILYRKAINFKTHAERASGRDILSSSFVFAVQWTLCPRLRHSREVRDQIAGKYERKPRNASFFCVRYSRKLASFLIHFKSFDISKIIKLIKLYTSKSILLSLVSLNENLEKYIYTTALADHVDHCCEIYDWQRAHSWIHDAFLAESWIRIMKCNPHGEIIREHAWHLPRAVTMVQ